MKHSILVSLLAALTVMTACDDGDIYNNVDVDTSGRSVKLNAQVTGLSSWPEEYMIAIAGFEEGSEYASITKEIKADENGNVAMEMNNIPDKVTSVQFCVLDRLRRFVTTLKEADIEGIRDTIHMDLGTMDISMFNTIQQGFINTTCINCHGASNFSAAGLNLTEGKAIADMVGVDSKRVSGHKIVAPGDAANSVLHMVLNNESVEGITMNHFDLVSESNAKTFLPMIDSWINNGAE